MKAYPSTRYHPALGTCIVHSAADDAKLEAQGWVDSPAVFGVETCPGKTPDPAIAAIRESLSKAKDAPKPGKASANKASVSSKDGVKA